MGERARNRYKSCGLSFFSKLQLFSQIPDSLQRKPVLCDVLSMVLKSDTLLPLTAPRQPAPTLLPSVSSWTAIWRSCLLYIAVTRIPAHITKLGGGPHAIYFLLPTNHLLSIETALQIGSYNHSRRFPLQICRRRSEISGRSKLKGEYSSDGYSCGVLNDGPPGDELDEFQRSTKCWPSTMLRLVFKWLKNTLDSDILFTAFLHLQISSVYI